MSHVIRVPIVSATASSLVFSEIDVAALKALCAEIAAARQPVGQQERLT
jgi:hypothetical protein